MPLGWVVSIRIDFDDSDRAAPAHHKADTSRTEREPPDWTDESVAPVGDEIDLTTPGPIADGTPRHLPAPRSTEPVRKGATKRRLAIGSLVALVILGGGLALVPSVGPFGASFVADHWSAKENARRLLELRESTNVLLGEDTGHAVASALERCKSVQRAMRRFGPVKAWCAYVALERGLRFGRRSEDEAYARLLLDDAGKAGGDPGALAFAASALLNGQATQAAQALQPLGGGISGVRDESVAVMAARIATMAKGNDCGKTAWSAAVGVRKNARTLFGLASAQYATGDLIQAESTARAALSASPDHAGARILLARLAVQHLDREAHAVALLNEVTAPGHVRDQTDTSETVDALTLLGQLHLRRSAIFPQRSRHSARR